MKYCVTNCMNDEVFFSTRATTACGMAEAAFRALHQDINQWFYYAPDEVINGLMDSGLTRFRANCLYAVSLEGIAVYEADYIRSAGAYRRSYRIIEFDFDLNEVF